MVVRVWKCRSFVQSTALEQVPEEAGNVVNVEARVVFVGRDQEVLRQRKLALAEQGVGDREDFLRPAHCGVGDVALAGDRQEQGMDAGGVDGVNGIERRRRRWG